MRIYAMSTYSICSLCIEEDEGGRAVGADDTLVEV